MVSVTSEESRPWSAYDEEERPTVKSPAWQLSSKAKHLLDWLNEKFAPDFIDKCKDIRVET